MAALWSWERWKVECSRGWKWKFSYEFISNRGNMITVMMLIRSLAEEEHTQCGWDWNVARAALFTRVGCEFISWAIYIYILSPMFTYFIPLFGCMFGATNKYESTGVGDMKMPRCKKYFKKKNNGTRAITVKNGSSKVVTSMQIITTIEIVDMKCQSSNVANKNWRQLILCLSHRAQM